MTTAELLPLFKAKVDELGQVGVARRIGRSTSTVCQLYNGTYPSDPAGVLRKFEEEFCSTTINCPVMGQITLKRCSEERATPFSASSPRRVKMSQACKECGGKQ